MRHASWVGVCILVLSASLGYAGENEGATISFDLEREGEAEAGNQNNEALTDVEPGESLVLSVYADGVSNLATYAVWIRFDTTQVSFEGGDYANFDLFERDVFREAGLTPSSSPMALALEDSSIVVFASSVLPVPGEDDAPDGDGKLLAWMKFTTRDTFEGEASFSLISGNLKGLEAWFTEQEYQDFLEKYPHVEELFEPFIVSANGEVRVDFSADLRSELEPETLMATGNYTWDEVSSEGVEAVAAAPIIAVELGSWGRIKAMMGW